MSSSGSTGGGGSELPGWLSTLQVLVPLASAIAAAGTNPKAWLEDFIFRKVAEWVVGGVINSTQYVLGWLIFAYERTVSILFTALPPLRAPFSIVEDAVVGVIDSMFGLAVDIAQTAGLAGPPATAFAIVLLGTLIAAVSWAILKAIPGSDLFEGAAEAFRR
jgi:hypothetical protein